MDDVVRSVLEDETSELIPEELTVVPGKIGTVETRRITCPEENFFISFRVWGMDSRVVLVFFRAEDSEEWQLVECAKGSDVEAHFPGNGYYAVGAGW